MLVGFWNLEFVSNASKRTKINVKYFLRPGKIFGEYLSC